MTILYEVHVLCDVLLSEGVHNFGDLPKHTLLLLGAATLRNILL